MATRQDKHKYPIGYFHIDIAEVRTEEGKLYLVMAIDRTWSRPSRWCKSGWSLRWPLVRAMWKFAQLDVELERG